MSDDFYYHTEKVVKTPMHRFHYHNDRKEEFQQKLADFLAGVKRKVSKEELEKAFADLNQFVKDHKIHKSIMAPMLRDLYRDIIVKFKSGNKLATEVAEFPIEFFSFSGAACLYWRLYLRICTRWPTFASYRNHECYAVYREKPETAINARGDCRGSEFSSIVF